MLLDIHCDVELSEDSAIDRFAKIHKRRTKFILSNKISMVS